MEQIRRRGKGTRNWGLGIRRGKQPMILSGWDLPREADRRVKPLSIGAFYELKKGGALLTTIIFSADTAHPFFCF
jgi:hypothetical protein